MNFGRILKKKAPLKEDEVDREDLGDRWTFVHVLPRSSFIQTVHHGKRTKEAGWEFVQKIKQNSDGEAPLFLSDGWPSYPDLLAHAYSHEEPVAYSGRGRPQNPIRVIDANLKYAQQYFRQILGGLAVNDAIVAKRFVIRAGFFQTLPIG
jgi:hypothetical protein